MGRGNAFSQIRDRFWLPKEKLYSEFALMPGGRLWRGNHPSFMWGVGVQLSALNAAAAIEPEPYLSQAIEYADAIDVYWLEANGIEGFDVQPGPKTSDRYYDDNAWLVLALCELHKLSDEARFLDRAIATFEFVISGEDDKLGGGLYWRELEKTSKNTCTNAPAIASALQLHRITGKVTYLQMALQLHAWTVKNLQDGDGLFWDHVKMNGDIDRRKFSYNTALMIRSSVLLHEITKDAKYLSEANRMAEAAKSLWVTDDGAVRDSGRFAHLLLESFLELGIESGDTVWRDTVEHCLAYLHTHVRDEDGWYGHRWAEPQQRSRRRTALLDQSSPARIYWLAAQK